MWEELAGKVGHRDQLHYLLTTPISESALGISAALVRSFGSREIYTAGLSSLALCSPHSVAVDRLWTPASHPRPIGLHVIILMLGDETGRTRCVWLLRLAPRLGVPVGSRSLRQRQTDACGDKRTEKSRDEEASSIGAGDRLLCSCRDSRGPVRPQRRCRSISNCRRITDRPRYRRDASRIPDFDYTAR